jgi:hypothetical protein
MLTFGLSLALVGVLGGAGAAAGGTLSTSVGRESLR